MNTSRARITTVVLTVTIAFMLPLMLLPVQAAAAVHRDFVIKWWYNRDTDILEIVYDVDLLRAGGYGAAKYIMVDE